MKKIATSSTLFLLLAAAVTVQAQEIHYLSTAGEVRRGVRCATLDGGEPERFALKAEALGGAIAEKSTVIPVRFHVVHLRNGSGDVSDQQIQDQVAVLNTAFSGSGFSFTLASIDRSISKSWYTGCYNQESRMKSSLAIDPAHNLNIYTCSPSGGMLGWSYFPWSLAETDPLHGVAVLNESLPGGSAAPYNQGDTVVHHVGHYLGLYHTCSGCTGDDEVADTPACDVSYGCPVGVDTCPADPGLDPINNYMGLSDDACMNALTPGQHTRMQQMVTLYKPSL
jgi:hypothetical protein